MNKKLLIIIITLLSCYTFNNKEFLSQWVPSNGPWSGKVNGFISSGTNLFAGTNGDCIFNSTNNGVSWSKLNSPGVTNNNVKCFIKTGNNVFAGTENGVFLTTNNGTTWYGVNSGISNVSVNTFAALNTNIFIGTNSGVYVTTNNGNYWNYSSYGISSYIINSMAVLGTNVYAATSSGVYKSTDNGGSWSPVNAGLINQNVNSLLVYGSNLFAGTVNISNTESVYKSSDHGNSWLPAGLLNLNVTSLVSSTGYLYAGTTTGVYRSSNNGTNWSSELGLLTLQIISLYNTGTSICAGTPFGMYISTDGGTAWNATGYKHNEILSMAANNSKLYALTLNSAYLSSNNGNSWKLIDNNTVTGIYDGDITAAGTTVFRSYNRYNPNYAYVSRTTNDGLNWIDVSGGFTNRHINCIKAESDSAVYIGFNYRSGYPGIWKLGLGGVGSTTGLENQSVTDIALKDSMVFAATENDIYRSTNGGENWTSIGHSGNYLAVLDENIYSTVSTGGVFRSTNNGLNWINIGLQGKETQHIAAEDNAVIVGTHDNGFYATTNNGIIWFSKNQGLDSIPVNIRSIVINDNMVFSAIDNISVWKRSLYDFIGVQNISNEVPSEFKLSQNYPNPFNPSTKIKFEIPLSRGVSGSAGRGVFVKLIIYDVLGKEVAALINEKLSPGTYEVDWNASDYPSGVYFYRLITESFSETKRMVLIK
ncbi:MAG: T9SS C-terminal target domain-containing protein [Ignavibacteriae bacterium]|nr:MAG: T9SS C-terminal target domain-containing protein [Ignavibacteriota bacterium]